MLPGCPRVLHTDLGTENCTIAKIHIAFRMNHDDPMSGSRSFIYGPSTVNIVRHVQLKLGIIMRIKKNFRE